MEDQKTLALPSLAWKMVVDIYNLEYDGIGQIQRFITVSGNVKECKNLAVPMGTPFREILNICGGLSLSTCLVLEGGPMSGKAVDVDKAYVSGNTEGIFVVKKDHTQEKACIHCGACADVCPARIFPFKIEKAYANQKFLFEELSPEACMECGRCSYICPSKIPLKERVVLAKKEKGNFIHWRETKKHKTGHYVCLVGGEELPPAKPQVHMSPYVRSSVFKEQIDFHWFVALLPSLLLTAAALGTRGIFNMLTSALTCVVSHVLFRRVVHHEKAPHVWEALNMGILIAFVFPVAVPPWRIIAAGVFGSIVVKELFGGNGSQTFHPALLAGVLFAHGTSMIALPFSWITLGVGFIYLVYTKEISMWPSIWYLFTVWAVGLFRGEIFLLSGPLLLTAFFMLTDFAVSPTVRMGKIFSGVLAGSLAGSMWGLGYGDLSWYFSVLMVNPLLEVMDQLTAPVPYGKMPAEKIRRQYLIKSLTVIFIAVGFIYLAYFTSMFRFTGQLWFTTVKYFWFGLAVWGIYKRMNYMYREKGILKNIRFMTALVLLTVILEKMRI